MLHEVYRLVDRHRAFRKQRADRTILPVTGPKLRRAGFSKPMIKDKTRNHEAASISSGHAKSRSFGGEKRCCHGMVELGGSDTAEALVFLVGCDFPCEGYRFRYRIFEPRAELAGDVRSSGECLRHRVAKCDVRSRLADRSLDRIQRVDVARTFPDQAKMGIPNQPRVGAIFAVATPNFHGTGSAPE